MSGSDVEKKKMKRMLSNRESARRSRLKRQKYLEELINEKAALEKRIQEEQQKYVSVFQSHRIVKSHNQTLEEEKEELMKYLAHLNRMIGKFKQAVASSRDQKIGGPDQYMNSWPMQSITALGLFTS